MKNNHYESLFEGGKYGQLNMASVPRVCGNVRQSPLIELQHFLFWKLTIRQRRKKKKRPVHGIQLFSWRLHHSFFLKNKTKTICFLRVVIVISELKHDKLSEVSDQTTNAQSNCG